MTKESKVLLVTVLLCTGLLAAFEYHLHVRTVVANVQTAQVLNATARPSPTVVETASPSATATSSATPKGKATVKPAPTAAPAVEETTEEGQ